MGLDPVLQAAINAHDNEEIEKSNAHVLGVVAEAHVYYDDGYEEDDFEEEEGEEEGSFIPESQSSVRSEPPTQTRPKSKAPPKVNGGKVGAPKTKHLKNPVQACKIMMKNLECF